MRPAGSPSPAGPDREHTPQPTPPIAHGSPRIGPQAARARAEFVPQVVHHGRRPDGSRPVTPDDSGITPGVVIRGRQEAFDVLERMLGQVRAGQGGALTIAAGPGMGRTALVAEAVRRAAPDVRTFGSRGVRHEASVPFAGLHGLLRPLPCLPELLRSLPAAQARTVTAVLANGTDPAEVGAALHTAVHALLAEAARAGPLLFWIDDVHWMDRPSLEALAFAARRISTEPVAMLFAVRDDPPFIAGRQRLDGIPRLPLSPLNEADSLHVLTDLTGAVDEGLADELAELAAGCPRALVDLAAALTPAQLSGDAPPPRELPGDSALRVYYRRRRRRLPPGARRLALLVSAGERLDLVTLARAATAEGLNLGDLETARNAGLIHIEGDLAQPPSPLVRSCVYADASFAERRSAHALLAQVLDQDRHRHRRSFHRAALAQEPDERLARELTTAAEYARTTSAFAEASRLGERAADLTTTPGAKADRLQAAAADAWTAGRPRRARVLLRRVRTFADTPERIARADLLQGEIALADGLPATAVDLLLRAAERLDPSTAATALAYAGEAADLAGDHASHIRAASLASRLPRPTDPAHELALSYLGAMGRTFQGRHQDAAVHLDRVLQLAETTDDCAALIWASQAALMHDHHHRARALATLAVTRTGPQRPAALTMLARCEMALGRYPVAVAVAQEGACAARAAGQRNREVELLATLALLAAFLGDSETAVRHLNEMGNAAGERGLNRAAAYATWALGFLALAEDRPADAAARLKRLTGAGTAHIVVRVVAIPHFVEAAVRSGRRRAAQRAFATYEAWATRSAGSAGRALMARCRALLSDDADAHFAEALGLLRHGDSPFELARTELLYGQHLRRDRRPRDAREHLRTALELFEQVGATRWADRARTELRAAGEALTPEADANLESLTAQQLRIARLVADGATNKEIASRLVISPRTVDHHLRNVFTRLGIRSRVELAKLVR